MCINNIYITYIYNIYIEMLSLYSVVCVYFQD